MSDDSIVATVALAWFALYSGVGLLGELSGKELTAFRFSVWVLSASFGAAAVAVPLVAVFG